jgi:hypothetical protein
MYQNQAVISGDEKARLSQGILLLDVTMINQNGKEIYPTG